MSSHSEDLAELHRLLLELEEVEEMLTSGPRKVATHDRLATKKQAECDQQKALITDLRKAADAKSLQLKTNEARIQDLNAKLNIAASNREYEIIKSQMEADTMANSVLEDEILEALDKVDVSVATHGELQKAHAAQVEKGQKIATEVAASAAGLQEKATALNGQIELAEKKVPTSAMEMYRRLRGAHGAGCLSSVEGAACSECNSELSQQQRVGMNLGKALFCPSCARLLYRA